MSERVRIEREDGVARVFLARPEKRNALDGAMFEALAAAADELAGEAGLRAVVLAGDGPAFCAGLDLAAFMARPQDLPGMLAPLPGEPVNLFQKAAWAWHALPVPVIAAIRGPAYGGGLQIALGADIRLLAPDAALSVMEIRWGLVPDMAGSRLLAELVGADVAKELTWTGRIVEAEEAVRLGLATRVVDDPLAEATALARDIAARSPDAVRAGKYLLNRSRDLGHADGLALEARVQARLLGGPNQLEAARAGMEGREPRFRDPVFRPADVEGQEST